MNSQLYKEILEGELLTTIRAQGLKRNEVWLLHDGDPKHTSSLVETTLQKLQIRPLYWPAQLPDLNPIEHVWRAIKRQLNRYLEPPDGVHELWRRVQVEWSRVPRTLPYALVASMPRRIAAVVRARGSHTDTEALICTLTILHNKDLECSL